MEQVLNQLKENLGNTREFVLKTGETVAVAIDKVIEHNGTVQILNATGIRLLEEAQNQQSATEVILNNDNHYDVYSINEISEIR